MAKFIPTTGVIQLETVKQDDELVYLIRTGASGKIDFGKGLSLPIQIEDKHRVVVETELSDEGRAALRLFVAEVKSLVGERCRKEAEGFCGKMGVKLEE